MIAVALQPSASTPVFGVSSQTASYVKLDRLCDAKVVREISRGSSEALSELYHRHAQLLMALALRIVRNCQDAEEVLQEVFFYVWRKAADYDASRSSVFSWLVVITRSRSLDRLRLRQRAGDWEEIQNDEPAPPDPTAGFGHVLNGQRADRLRRALRRLPKAQRQVLELAFYRGWTQREVAEKVGVPIGTVKTRTFLAMKKLRRELMGEIDTLM